MLKKIAKKALGKKHNPLSDYSYSIDVVESTQISGWAKNNKLPSHNPVIDVYVNGALIWQTKCDQARVDLVEQQIGNYAFALIPNISALTESCNQVQIYIDGHVLPQSFPLAIQIEQTTPIQTASISTQTQSTKTTKYIFNVDNISDKSIVGWAKVNQPDDYQRVYIELRTKGSSLAKGEASNFRQDLANNKIGDGKFAFELVFDLAAFPSNKILADVYINNELHAANSVMLEVDPNEVEHARYTKEFAPQLSELQQLLNTESRRIYQVLCNKQEADPSVQDTLDFVIQSIAELNTRMSVMEKSILKTMSKK